MELRHRRYCATVAEDLLFGCRKSSALFRSQVRAHVLPKFHEIRGRPLDTARTPASQGFSSSGFLSFSAGSSLPGCGVGFEACSGGWLGSALRGGC